MAPARAELTASQPAPTVQIAPEGTAVVAGAAQAPQADTLLVMQARSDNVPQALLRVIATSLTTELATRTSMTVLSAADVAQIADLAATQQNLGCDDSNCLSQIAGALGARYVIYGDAVQLGELLVVNLSLFDVTTATVAKRTSLEIANVQELPARVRAAAPLLLPDGAHANATATTAFPFGFVAVGGGGAAVVVGVVVDVLSPTSANRKLDAVDFVGPALVVVGVSVAAAGLAWLAMQ